MSWKEILFQCLEINNVIVWEMFIQRTFLARLRSKFHQLALLADLLKMYSIVAEDICGKEIWKDIDKTVLRGLNKISWKRTAQSSSHN